MRWRSIIRGIAGRCFCIQRSANLFRRTSTVPPEYRDRRAPGRRLSRCTLGRRLYELNIGKPQIAPRETVRNLLKEAGSAVDGNKFSQQFLTTEWEQVVDARQLDTWEDYRDVSRLGRKTRLKEPQRLILWSIFEQVRAALKSQGLITDSGLFNVLASRYRSGVSSPFDFAVVDEAQDISIAQLRFQYSTVQNPAFKSCQLSKQKSRPWANGLRT